MKDSDIKKLSKPKRLIFATTIVIVCVGVTLLALEVLVRIFRPGMGDLAKIVTQASGSDSRPYSLKPGARVGFRGFYKSLEKPAVWEINAQGIRSDRPMPPRSKKFRIVTFGDSETFGWAVPLAFTFQRRMEQIDDNVEVINLGTPGYNAENIADHMKEVLAHLGADIVLYIAHRNDVDPTLTYSPILAKSYFLIYINVKHPKLLRFIFPKLKERRHSPEKLKYFVNQVDRMIDICQRENVPLLIGFLDWRFAKALPPPFRIDHFQTLKKSVDTVLDKPVFRVGSVNIEHGWMTLPRIDDHMSQAGHQETAEKICLAISAGKKHSCVPPYWHPTRDQ
jgi:hypothetical protein